MKRIFPLLVAILSFFALSAQAQTIQVYKDGQAIDTFSAAQVDSVVYKQVAAIPKYYYYVGTVQPTADSFVETNGKLISGSDSNVKITSDKVSEIIALPESEKWIYFVYPKEWGAASIVDKDGDNVGFADKSSLQSFSDINKYYVYRVGYGAGSMHCWITYK